MIASRNKYCCFSVTLFAITVCSAITANPQSLPILLKASPIKDNNPAGIALSEADVNHDMTLNYKVSITAEEMRIDDLFELISNQTRIHLKVSESLSARKVSCKLTNQPLNNVLLSITHVFPASLRRKSSGYELFLTDEQIAKDRRKILASEAREKDFLSSQAGRLEAQLNEALSKSGSERDCFANYVSDIDRENLYLAIPSALEEEQRISATDQSHFFSHTFNQSSFGSLSDAQRHAVSQIASEGGQQKLSPDAQIALISAAGSFRLGIFAKGMNDMWVAPNHSIGSVSTLSPQVRENDFDNSLVDLLRNGKLVDLSRLRKIKKEMSFKPFPGMNSPQLARNLNGLSTVTGIDFLCDAFLNSKELTIAPDLPFQSNWTTETVLPHIVRAFAHRMIYRNGILEASTMTTGLDLRLEAPVSVMNSLDRQAKTKSLPYQSDLLVLGKCTKDQLWMLSFRHPVMTATKTGHIFQAVRIYHLLHFYSMLTPEQQKLAFSLDGLPYNRMSAVQRIKFNQLFKQGELRKYASKFRKNTFHVVVDTFEFDGYLGHKKRDSVYFTAVAPYDATVVHSGGL